MISQEISVFTDEMFGDGTYAEVGQFTEESVTIANLRNVEDLQTYPFLKPIRDAVICAFDFMVEAKTNARQPEIAELSDDDIIWLARSLGLPIDQATLADDTGKNHTRQTLIANRQDELEAALWMHKATKGKCTDAARVVRYFLSQYHPDLYECCLLGTEPLTYFDHHTIALVRYVPSDWHIAVSPANIFNYCANRQGDFFTFPHYRNEPFQRATTIIMSQNQQAVLQTLMDIEGGTNWWEDRTGWQYAPIGFGYDDQNGQRRYMSLEDFVKRWTNFE